MRVLVTLDLSARKDPGATESVKAKMADCGFKQLEGKHRLERLGILVGEIDPNQRNDLLQIKGIKSVDADQIERAT